MVATEVADRVDQAKWKVAKSLTIHPKKACQKKVSWMFRRKGAADPATPAALPLVAILHLTRSRQEPPRVRGCTSGRGVASLADSWAGHRPLAEPHSARCAKKFVQLTCRQEQQEPLTDGLRPLTLGTIEFRGGECAKLPVHGLTAFTMRLRISRSTWTGCWVPSTARTRLGP